MSHRARNTQDPEIQEKRGCAMPTKQKLSPLIALIDNPAEDFKSRYRNIKTSTATAPHSHHGTETEAASNEVTRRGGLAVANTRRTTDKGTAAHAAIAAVTSTFKMTIHRVQRIKEGRPKAKDTEASEAAVVIVRAVPAQLLSRMSRDPTVNPSVNPKTITHLSRPSSMMMPTTKYCACLVLTTKPS